MRPVFIATSLAVLLIIVSIGVRPMHANRSQEPRSVLMDIWSQSDSRSIYFGEDDCVISFRRQYQLNCTAEGGLRAKDQIVNLREVISFSDYRNADTGGIRFEIDRGMNQVSSEIYYNCNGSENTSAGEAFIWVGVPYEYLSNAVSSIRTLRRSCTRADL